MPPRQCQNLAEVVAVLLQNLVGARKMTRTNAPMPADAFGWHIQCTNQSLLNAVSTEEKDAEDEVINRTSELRKLSENIDKATTAVINASLSLESSIRQTQRAEGVLGAAVNTVSNKVDTIDKHIDQVMEDAPTKLKVTVTVCDTDWQKIQELHDQWLEQEKQMLADQYKQQETLWQKQSHRLTDIVRNNEGVWLSAKLFYVVGSLSLLSIITIVLEIAFYVYFHL